VSTDWHVHLPPDLPPDAVDFALGGTLPGRWLANWRANGSARVLKDVDGRWLTADELEQRTREAAERLRTAGLAPGQRLVVVAESSGAFVIAYVAALRAGLTVVPVNPAYPEPEVNGIVAAAAPAAALVADDERAGWIRRAAGADLPIGDLGLDGLASGGTGGAGDAGLDTASPDDVALLVYTSGTTGRPKGVPLSHANLLASAAAVNLAWRWEPTDQLLLTLPLFHVHGLGVGINGSFTAGAAVILRPGFDPADVGEHRATLFFGVPTMYQRLRETGHASALSGLRLIVSGSAPLPAELAARIEETTGQMPLERYGMTETLLLAGNPYDGERRPGTVGFPFPGVELRITADQEVQVRGPNVIKHYLDRPDATAEAFTDDGWFRTGDLGERDADGYLRLVGRSKELIISGGYNVYPREVEEVLATHPGVREVAVVGRPSERWGEEVTAVVVAEGAIEEAELRAHAAKQLAPYKVPKRVEFTTELPRNALGKVVRRKL
jgi:malonyl-CoA/methylmalonyl-CoA synthetase